MSEEKNIYDFLIAAIPSVILGAISIATLIYSNRRHNKDQFTSFRSTKIENLYEKLLSINGSINAELSKYRTINDYWIKQEKIGEIIKGIELLKVEAVLYFNIHSIDELRIYSERLLKQLIYVNGSKNNLNDGEYETEGNEYHTIIPTTIDRYYDEYDKIYSLIESKIEMTARKILGIKVEKIKVWRHKKIK